MKTRNTDIAGKLNRTGLVIAIIVLTGTSLFGQKSFTSFNWNSLFTSDVVAEESAFKSAVAMVEVDHYEGSLEFVVEEFVEVENWMTTDNQWNTSENVFEEEIELENWMHAFSQENTASTIAMEAWMTSSKTWN